MKSAYIVSGKRTAIGKAPRGTLKNTRPDDLAALTIQAILKEYPKIDPAELEDVIVGCAMPEAEQGMNVARIASLRAGLPDSVPAMTVNRFCSSGLQTIAIASERIMCGFADCILAGGTESMSLVPMGGHKISPNPTLIHDRPETYLSMGLTAERVAKQFNVSRNDQDEFSLKSHQKAMSAIQNNKFESEVVPVPIQVNGATAEFKVDEGPRSDTTLQALSKLKPSFQVNGTVTPGNSSQMSDGAAMVMVVSEAFLKRHHLVPILRVVSFSAAGVAPDIMGIGPMEAIPKSLKLAGLTLKDMDLIELNEAFASQAVAVIRNLHLNSEIVNVNGGAIALGHPLGCTGALLTVKLINELKRRKGKYGIVSMCIGGGMGASAVFENC